MRKFRTNFFAATAILCALFIGAMSFCCGLTKEQKEEQTKADVESTLSAAQEAIDALNFENAEEAAKIDSIVTSAGVGGRPRARAEPEEEVVCSTSRNSMPTRMPDRHSPKRPMPLTSG